MRLDKALALTGLSRTQAKALIAAGRVQVCGRVVRDPGQSVETEDILLDGAPIDARREVYLMINKPAGVVTATEDKHLPTVVSLLPEKYARRKIGPVGRLDRDVTGLVLLTTDGQLAHRLISPRHKAEKLYRAVCEGELTDADVRRFAEGLQLSDFTALPAELRILSAGETSQADVILTEGKFHQVKRMFAAVGHPLISLKRLRIGSLWLDESLKEGEFRLLTDEEVEALVTLGNRDQGLGKQCGDRLTQAIQLTTDH